MASYLVSVAPSPDPTPAVVQSAPATSGGVSWTLFWAGAGVLVTVGVSISGAISAFFWRQFDRVDGDINRLISRSDEQFQQQGFKFAKLFDLVRELDSKYVTRNEFDREIERNQSSQDQLVERIEGQLSAIREDLRSMRDGD